MLGNGLAYVEGGVDESSIFIVGGLSITTEGHEGMEDPKSFIGEGLIIRAEGPKGIENPKS